MVMTENSLKLEFSTIAPDKKGLFTKFLWENDGRGCEMSFANLCLWGEQGFALVDGHILILSKFGDRYIYLYPLGSGDKRTVIDRIISDSSERGIRLRILGLSPADMEEIDRIYEGRFRFFLNEDTFDYVYDINDLAELKGKKYHGKRNHIARFKEAIPNYKIELISENNSSKILEMAEAWYAEREEESGSYETEKIAIKRAMENYSALGFEGLALMDGDRVIGFTVASRMSRDTFDVHFEKAFSDIQGAYAVINQELALYIRSKYPDVKYLDREEDMGIDGLRRAKKSYYPHHMIEKYTAYLED